MKPLSTPKGRTFVVLGDAGVITMDRLAAVSDYLDSDPRIASVSIVAHPDPGQEFLRATAPAGCAVVVATDLERLAGPLPDPADAQSLAAWAHDASERGLWHDWWLSSARDVARALEFIAPSVMDVQESEDLSTSRHTALKRKALTTAQVSLTVDATWLGTHQTGAQVMTTAALEALAASPRVCRIHLVGIEEFPDYAVHIAGNESVHIGPADEPTDVIWYPNQIDQRVDITFARTLGRRVVTTYLDLIAYDIRRYHASHEAWAAYRSLQRRIALSVDGITTISADVATRLMQEVPRLDSTRVQPIPLGLNHVRASEGVSHPDADIADLCRQLGARPFLLVLGNDFLHKNRDFAVRVWEQVLARGTNCDLVLAGLHVKSSSSRDRESALLASHTNLRGAAYTVGHVTPASREWLMTNAAAVVYPSSAEGFGFVPYEAAALGTPSTFTSFGPLAEISRITGVPRSWSVEAYAEDVIALLDDPGFARARVDSLRAIIGRSTWAEFADQLLDFFTRIDALPPVEAALVGGTAADASALAAVLSSKTWRATEPLRRVGRKIKGRN